MVQQSLVKRTREAKRNAAVSVIAMRLAKEKDDIIWKKASKFKKLFVAAKDAINKKYGQRASIEWMKKQNENKAKK